VTRSNSTNSTNPGLDQPQLSFNQAGRSTSFAPHALLPYRAFASRLRRELTVADLKLAESDMNRQVDLGPYMNAAAMAVHPSARLSRVHLLFRSLGLRHLTVTNSENTVLGMITRRDITDITMSLQTMGN